MFPAKAIIEMNSGTPQVRFTILVEKTRHRNNLILNKSVLIWRFHGMIGSIVRRRSTLYTNFELGY